jgi:hypothetical protein
VSASDEALIFLSEPQQMLAQSIPPLNREHEPRF